jgi:hypothetical protein
VKRKSNWIVFVAAVGLLFTVGYRILPRPLWLLESVLIVLGLFLLKEAIDEMERMRNEKKN